MPSLIQNPRLLHLSHCRQLPSRQIATASASLSDQTLAPAATSPPQSSILSTRESLLLGRTTAVSVASDCLSLLKQAEPLLRSFIHVAESEALRSAEELDRRIENGKEVGPLAGVMVGVKNNLCTADMASIGGSRILEGYKPAFDATVVKRLWEKGAIVVGKTNLDEFGMRSTTEGSGFQRNRVGK